MANKIKYRFSCLKNNNKIQKYFTVGFFAVILFLFIKVGYAYYTDNHTVPFVTSVVANYAGSNDEADIVAVIYKQDGDNYIKTKYVPVKGYIFNDDLTVCRSTYDKEIVACSYNDSTADCYYEFDNENKEFMVTSKEMVVCSYYFDKEATNDIIVYILMEDASGTYTRDESDKNYSIGDIVPAYGYSYSTYSCNNEATLTYDSNLRKYSVSTTKAETTCYMYFDSYANKDIKANVYVQSEVGSELYNEVQSIPSSNAYTLNSSKTTCTNGSTVEYNDGYIEINASGLDTCDVYLDIVE